MDTVRAKSEASQSVEAAVAHQKTLCLHGFCWWAGSESNTRHKDFQSFALPTELPAHRVWPRPHDAIGANGERIIRTDDCRALQRLHRLRPAIRDSTKSITLPSRFTPSSRSISCTPVGLVTLTSVR